MADHEELLERIDMEWLLDREGITYRESYGRSGRQLNVRTCPACGSSGYKVYMNAESGLGNCFSADCPSPKFGKWKFIANLFDVRGRAMNALLQDLAREQGWRPKRESVAAPQVYGERELPEAVEVASMPEVPEYLARRGIDKALAGYFGLQWCERGKFSVEVNGLKIVQDYSNRILLPVLDLDQTLVTFQGRDVTGTAEKRYLFPPTFAASGAYLYNGFNWQPGMDTLVICEGVFDVIGAKRAIDAHMELRDMLPVGTFGMHLSMNSPAGDDQFGRLRQLMKVGLKRVIFLWDGEYKAVKAAAEASIHLRGIGLEAYVAILPVKKDPGDATTVEIRDAILGAHRACSKPDLLKLLTVARNRLGNT